MTDATTPASASSPPQSSEGKDAAGGLDAYCCQQIQIPPLLPSILKAYTKGAIRTQPRDLLQWSAAYFRAMANGEVPPVKERLEYPVVEAPSGLSRGLLRVLHKQMIGKEQTTAQVVKGKWMGICLNPKDVDALLQGNGLGEEFQWTKFLVSAAASIAKDDIVETMKITCEVLTNQPDGSDPSIPYIVWWDLYLFMAQKSHLHMDRVQAVNDFLKALAGANYEMIGPKDFLSQECPPLY